MGRRLIGATGTVALLSALAWGCGGDAETTGREAALYASAIRALVPPVDPVDDGPTVTREVFVYVAADEPPSIDLQARVIESLAEFTTLRFVDDPSEAIDDEAPRAPARNAGVLLTLGALQGTGSTVFVEGERCVDEDHVDEHRLQLRRYDARWDVVEPPGPPPEPPPDEPDEPDEPDASDASGPAGAPEPGAPLRVA